MKFCIYGPFLDSHTAIDSVLRSFQEFDLEVLRQLRCCFLMLDLRHCAWSSSRTALHKTRTCLQFISVPSPYIPGWVVDLCLVDGIGAY